MTVTVGAGDDLAFDPPAVHVDSGTTVVFEWDQGLHNVAEKGSGERYASETADEPTTTYAVAFESDGVSMYICEFSPGAGHEGRRRRRLRRGHARGVRERDTGRWRGQ
ncbi:hypothetical protein BRC84_02870 [Halobacteriales archaeon QS_1_68_44]|nr:MAG: hypothetical protein BRC84_02870 [Halobacteriales archaeon QS_1_68_44]